MHSRSNTSTMSVDLAELNTTSHIFYLDDILLKDAYTYLYKMENEHPLFAFTFRPTKRIQIRADTSDSQAITFFSSKPTCLDTTLSFRLRENSDSQSSKTYKTIAEGYTLPMMYHVLKKLTEYS